jgi:hypothetical protein
LYACKNKGENNEYFAYSCCVCKAFFDWLWGLFGNSFDSLFFGLMSLFKPATSRERAEFENNYCLKCANLKSMNSDGCNILFRSLMLQLFCAAYPKELTYDSNGKGTCSNFLEK